MRVKSERTSVMALVLAENSGLKQIVSPEEPMASCSQRPLVVSPQPTSESWLLLALGRDP